MQTLFRCQLAHLRDEQFHIVPPFPVIGCRIRNGYRTIDFELWFKQPEAHIFEITTNTSVVPAYGLVSYLVVNLVGVQVLLEHALGIFVDEGVICELGKNHGYAYLTHMWQIGMIYVEGFTAHCSCLHMRIHVLIECLFVLCLC